MELSFRSSVHFYMPDTSEDKLRLTIKSYLVFALEASAVDGSSAEAPCDAAVVSWSAGWAW